MRSLPTTPPGPYTEILRKVGTTFIRSNSTGVEQGTPSTDGEDQLNAAIVAIAAAGGGDVYVHSSVAPLTGSQVVLDSSVAVIWSREAFATLTTSTDTAHTIQPWERTIIMTGLTADRQVTLPDPTTFPTSEILQIKGRNLGGFDVTFSRTIDGDASFAISTDDGSIAIQSDGTEWLVVS